MICSNDIYIYWAFPFKSLQVNTKGLHTNIKSTLAHVVAWYRQVTSHFPNQRWPRFSLPIYSSRVVRKRQLPHICRRKCVNLFPCVSLQCGKTKYYIHTYLRADSRFGHRQWETVILCNDFPSLAGRKSRISPLPSQREAKLLCNDVSH